MKPGIELGARKSFEDMIGLKDIIVVAWRRRILIVIMFIASVILGTVYSFIAINQSYSSSAKVFLGQFGDKTSDVNSVRAIIISDVFLTKVFDELNLASNEGLAEKINVEDEKDANLIKITVTNKDPDIAKDIANKIAVNYSMQRNEEYNKKIADLNKEIDVIKSKIDEINPDIKETKNLLFDIEKSNLTQMEKGLWRFQLEDRLKYFEGRKDLFEDNILKLEKDKQLIEKSNVLNYGKVSKSPANTSRGSVIAGSGLMGLILGIIAAFFVDYIKKSGVGNIKDE